MYGTWPQNTAPNNWYWPPTTDPQPQWNMWTNYWISCPQCSKLVQWGSVYCPTCGAKMITEVTEKDKLDQIQQTLEKILKEVHSLSETAKQGVTE